MRIGIVANLNYKESGVYQYTLSLLEALLGIRDSTDNYILFSDTYHHPLFKIMKERGWVIVPLHPTSNKKIFIKKLLFKTLSEKLFVSALDKMHEIFYKKKDTNKSTNLEIDLEIKKQISKFQVDLMIYPTTNKLSLEVKIPFIITIHDFQHKYFPQFFSKHEIKERDYIFSHAAKDAHVIICESEFVKQDIIKVLQIPKDKIIVLSSPLPEYIRKFTLDKILNKAIINKYKLPKKYLFYPANFWPHKNHINLIRALNYLKKQYNVFIPLVCIGVIKSGYGKMLKEINRLKISNQVIYLGFVPELEKMYLYNNAYTLIMPSFFESLSIPIWEAFELGIPVAASNVCSLPQQVDIAGLVFDPKDPEDMAEKIYHLWTDQNLCKSLVEKGYNRIAKMTTEQYGKDWNKIIKKVSAII